MIIPAHPNEPTTFVLRRNRFPAGFTLTEICIVVSLFAVVSLAIFQTFSSGVKIWDQASQSFPEEDIFLSLEHLTRDAHNAFPFSLFKFQGEANLLVFPTMVITAADPRSGARDPYVQQIGQVRYGFDGVSKRFFRQQADYGQSTQGQWQPPRLLAEGVERLRFSYLYKDNNRLIERLQAEGPMPVMIKVEMEYRSGKDIRQMVRFIDVPVNTPNL